MGRQKEEITPHQKLNEIARMLAIGVMRLRPDIKEVKEDSECPQTGQDQQNSGD